MDISGPDLHYHCRFYVLHVVASYLQMLTCSDQMLDCYVFSPGDLNSSIQPQDFCWTKLELTPPSLDSSNSKLLTSNPSSTPRMVPELSISHLAGVSMSRLSLIFAWQACAHIYVASQISDGTLHLIIPPETCSAFDNRSRCRSEQEIIMSSSLCLVRNK